MSRPSREPTRHGEPSNCVLLVNGEDRLLQTAISAVTASSGGEVVSTDLAGAATAAALRRPYAIIVPSSIYDFDPTEFDALARDVQAAVVPVPETVHRDVLLALLIEAARAL